MRNSAQVTMHTENLLRLIILILHNSNTARVLYSEETTGQWLSLSAIQRELPGVCWVHLAAADENLFRHGEKPVVLDLGVSGTNFSSEVARLLNQSRSITLVKPIKSREVVNELFKLGVASQIKPWFLLESQTDDPYLFEITQDAVNYSLVQILAQPELWNNTWMAFKVISDSIVNKTEQQQLVEFREIGYRSGCIRSCGPGETSMFKDKSCDKCQSCVPPSSKASRRSHSIEICMVCIILISYLVLFVVAISPGNTGRSRNLRLSIFNVTRFCYILVLTLTYYPPEVPYLPDELGSRLKQFLDQCTMVAAIQIPLDTVVSDRVKKRYDYLLNQMVLFVPSGVAFALAIIDTNQYCHLLLGEVSESQCDTCTTIIILASQLLVLLWLWHRDVHESGILYCVSVDLMILLVEITIPEEFTNTLAEEKETLILILLRETVYVLFCMAVIAWRHRTETRLAQNQVDSSASGRAQILTRQGGIQLRETVTTCIVTREAVAHDERTRASSV